MDDMEGSVPRMTNREKVRSVLPKFEDEFRNDNQIVQMLDRAVGEALTVFYGEVIPEAAKLRKLVAAKLDAAAEEEDTITGGKKRSVKMVLPGWKVDQSMLGKAVAKPGAASEEGKLYMAIMRRSSDKLRVKDELRIYRDEPGFVQNMGEDRQWEDNLNRPTVDSHEPLSVWLGDPRKEGKAKVNMGSEIAPKSISEERPNVEKSVGLEAAQRFLDAYEAEYGRVDLNRFGKKVEETGLSEVLEVTHTQISDQEIRLGLVEKFFQTAVLYENMLRGRDVYGISGSEIMFGQGISQRDLRRPEGPLARIALQVLEQGEVFEGSSYKYSQEYFMPHLKKSGQN